jgi:CRISPR-associated endoribonuclease Cas6
LYRIFLNVHIPRSLRKPGIFTRQLHGYILRMIEQTDKPLASELHDQKDRQSFSLYVDPKGEGIFVSCLNKQVARALQLAWYNTLELQTPLLTTKIHQIDTQFISFDDLNFKEDRLRLRFLSPTTFYQYGKYYPLPEPQRIFSSAMKTFNQSVYAAEPLVWEDILHIVQEMVIADVNIHSTVVSFEKFLIQGFLGRIEFRLHRLTTEQKRKVWMLARILEIVGVGNKTAWGLGAVTANTHRVSKSPEGVRR